MRWRALIVLSLAQFLMVLDQAVMNVSISQLVEDFDTSVTVIQGVITFYALAMAAFMITGGKLGDRFGRKRAFGVGLIIYAAGSALTAVSQNVPTLLFGWSILEGAGAALVLPALVALIATNYKGADRALAYGVIGGVSGAGIAVGPILGGWVTTSFTWRYVFVGEVILAVIIVLLIGWIADAPKAKKPPEIDWVGAALSAAGLGLFVYGILQASTWGWLADRDSPIQPLGLSLTPFVIGAGILTLTLFASWSRRVETAGDTPLFRLGLLSVGPLRVGLNMLVLQNMILMGVFFSIPLYLQVVQGLDALETGVRMLPVSIAMFVASFVGARLSSLVSPRSVTTTGLWILLGAVLFLMSTIKPELKGIAFAASMALLGAGMGLIASQLGNLVQSSVGERDRSEAGGLQFTAQQLGSAVGTALIGAIVIGSLASVFVSEVQNDERVSDQLATEVSVSIDGSLDFVPTAAVERGLAEAGVPESEAGPLVDAYGDAQLVSLRKGLFVCGVVVVIGLFLARRIPDDSFEELAAQSAEPARV